MTEEIEPTKGAGIGSSPTPAGPSGPARSRRPQLWTFALPGLLTIPVHLQTMVQLETMMGLTLVAGTLTFALGYLAFVDRGWLPGLSVLVGSFVLSHLAGVRLCDWQQARSSAAGDTIASAIHGHHQLTGRYPDSLQDLVPAQLPAIPECAIQGITWRSEWSYRTVNGDLHPRAGYHDFILSYEGRGSAFKRLYYWTPHGKFMNDSHM